MLLFNQTRRITTINIVYLSKVVVCFYLHKHSVRVFLHKFYQKESKVQQELFKCIAVVIYILCIHTFYCLSDLYTVCYCTVECTCLNISDKASMFFLCSCTLLMRVCRTVFKYGAIQFFNYTILSWSIFT